MLDNSVQRKLEAVPLRGDISMVAVADDPNEVHIWRSCCLDMDSRALLFFSQLLISLLVLGFCVEQVVVLDESNSQWQRMTISLRRGNGLPAPRVQK